MQNLIGFVIMNKAGQYFGPGGWLDEPDAARIWEAADALKMLEAFSPSVSLIRVRVTGYKPEDTRSLPGFQSSSEPVGKAA